MAKNTQISKQIGEALVIAELGKRKCIATSFSGNVPYFDIVAINPKNKIRLIQVKAKNGGDWQLTIDKFWKIECKDEWQIRGDPTNIPNLSYIFVNLGLQNGFFICSANKVAELFAQNYFDDFYNGLPARKRKLNAKGKPVFHCKIKHSGLTTYENNWDIICGGSEKQKIKNL